MKRLIICVGISIVVGAISLAAQEKVQPYGQVIYAKGNDLSMLRGAALKTWDLGAGDVLGATLQEGDLVQTGQDSIVDIQILPGNSIIHIAEDTSFRITSLSEDHGITLDIIYGRIRAKIDAALAVQGFSVRGRTAVAEVIGTEFGFDVVSVAGIGIEPATQIYCYDGKVEVRALQADAVTPEKMAKPFDPLDAKDSKEVDVTQGKMVIVYDTTDTQALVSQGKAGSDKEILLDQQRSIVTKQSIEQSITAYWNDYLQLNPTPEKGDQSDQSIAAAVKLPSLADSIAPFSELDPIGSLTRKQYVMSQNNTKLIGIILTAVGLTANVMGLSIHTWGNNIFGISSAGAQAAGLVTTVGGSTVLITGISMYLMELFR